MSADTPTPATGPRDGGKPRGNPTDEKPFVWLSKTSLRTIRESETVKVRNPALTRSALLALAEIASDQGGPEFTVNRGLLAFRSAMSDRALDRCLRELEQLGLVTVRRSDRAPNSFAIISTADRRNQGKHPPTQPGEHGSRGGANGVPPTGSEQGSAPPSTEKCNSRSHLGNSHSPSGNDYGKESENFCAAPLPFSSQSPRSDSGDRSGDSELERGDNLKLFDVLAAYVAKHT